MAGTEKISISLSEADVPVDAPEISDKAVTETPGGISIDPSGIAAPEKKAERPAWLPEKFKTAEDLAKAYSELEKKQGAGAKAEDKVEADDKPAADKSGAAKPDTPEADAKALQEITAKLAEQAGSAEHLKATLEWAKEGASAEAVDAYNTALKTGNSALISAAFAALKAERVDALGEDPMLVDGEVLPGVAGTKGFASEGEMIRFMNDPRYKEGDTAYHAEFRRRMERTTFWDRK